MRRIAFIPVRGGSKSIPLKNIKDFAGKPLVYWVIKAAAECKCIDEIIVASDSNEINDVINSFLLNKVSIYERDSINAQDNSSTESVMLEYIKKKDLCYEDIFVLIQATSPLLETNDLERGITLFESKIYDSILSCVRLKRFFWQDNGTPINYNFAQRPRRQDFRGTYMENGAFYINTVKNILESQNRLTGNVGITEMPEYTGIELDEPLDWAITENIKYNLNKKIKYDIKLFISDVDGVLTDAGMYYTEKGDELKKFNTRDGKAFELLRNEGIKTAIITAENTKIVENRAKKIKSDYLYQGIKDKVAIATEICKKEGIELENVAFIGDDINDLELLKLVGYSATPYDGSIQNKAVVKYICKLGGGEGCVREFVEIILKELL